MKISDICKQKTTVSFEIFPIKDDVNLEKNKENVDRLVTLNPDFISVTYGAMGNTKGNTFEIAKYIKNEKNVEVLPHLTCINAKKSEINDIITGYKENNIENILALRGDMPKDNVLTNYDYKYASELVNELKSDHNMTVGAAFYPDGHFESNVTKDLFNLKHKVESGSDFLVSQIFFDNEAFLEFRDKLRDLDINIPVIAGIIPVTNINQVGKIVSMSNAKLTGKFERLLKKYQDDEVALRDAGIFYATEQICDLITSDIDGVHIYTLNKYDITKKIVDNIQNLI